jgi:hypothetical protein
MNSIVFTEKSNFLSAVSALETNDTPEYSWDDDILTIWCSDINKIIDLLTKDGVSGYTVKHGVDDEPFDGFRYDAEADADALKSAGFGTDEDYGHFGNDE